MRDHAEPEVAMLSLGVNVLGVRLAVPLQSSLQHSVTWRKLEQAPLSFD